MKIETRQQDRWRWEDKDDEVDKKRDRQQAGVCMSVYVQDIQPDII